MTKVPQSLKKCTGHLSDRVLVISFYSFHRFLRGKVKVMRPYRPEKGQIAIINKSSIQSGLTNHP